MKILIIGAGKMATALAGGMVRKGLFPPESITAIDPSADARKAFTAATGVSCLPEATEETTSQADVLLLAIKPQVAESVCQALPPRKPNVLVLSICAGIPLARLREWFEDARLVRVMPNTPLMVGEGASCYACSDENDRESDEFAAGVLGTLGQTWHVPERYLDAVTALSGSGPAYFFAFVEALRDGGTALGLPAELAEGLAIQTLLGAAEMLKRELGTPAALREAVTSKGGTTAAALEVLSQHDFKGLVAELMRAAANRSAELGRGGKTEEGKKR